MSRLTIEKDIEFIKNQVNYLDTFQKRIYTALTDLKNKGVYWKGFTGDELIFTEINRWLKSYATLKNHLTQKEVIDEELRKSLTELPQLVFTKPEQSKVLLQKKGGAAKFFYTVFPPYRKSFNRKIFKGVEAQITEHKKWGEKLRKLSFKIESVYTDGI